MIMIRANLQCVSWANTGVTLWRNAAIAVSACINVTVVISEQVKHVKVNETVKPYTGVFWGAKTGVSKNAIPPNSSKYDNGFECSKTLG